MDIRKVIISCQPTVRVYYSLICFSVLLGERGGEGGVPLDWILLISGFGGIVFVSVLAICTLGWLLLFPFPLARITVSFYWADYYNRAIIELWPDRLM